MTTQQERTDMEAEYGNDKACANCGDEWSPTYSKQGYCEECQEAFEQGNEVKK